MRQLVACLIAAPRAATTGMAQNYSTVVTLTCPAGSAHYEVNAVTFKFQARVEDQ